jgi:hypothetical protein
MGLMDLIDKARELIGGGGIDSLTENAGDISDIAQSGDISEIAQGEGGALEDAQQAVEGLGEGGDVGDAPGDPSGGSER